MSTLIFDLEGDNLVRGITKIHCIVTEDLDTGELNAYYEDDKDIYQGLLALYNADRIVGHNIIGFDIPAIKKLYPRWSCKAYDDTFILSCILTPLRPSHSIESYSDGLKVANEDWSCLTYNMLDRCVIDTKVCASLYRSQLKVLNSTNDFDKAIQIEYETYTNHQEQVWEGVDVDVELVRKTIDCLDQELEALSYCINTKIPYRVMIDKHQYKKFFNKDGSLPHFIKGYFGEDVESGLI